MSAVGINVCSSQNEEMGTQPQTTTTEKPQVVLTESVKMEGSVWYSAVSVENVMVVLLIAWTLVAIGFLILKVKIIRVLKVKIRYFSCKFPKN